MRASLYTGAGVSLALVLAGQTAQAFTFDSLSPGNLVRHLREERAATAPSSAYQYMGCYAEPSTGRALDKVKSDNAMTYQMCESICSESQYTFYGIEYGKECWCGNTLNANAKSLAESECTFKCVGDKTQSCGDRKKLSLFKRSDNGGNSESSDRKTVGAFAWQGCYVDEGNPRALTQRTASDALTPQSCAEQCSGYKYMGLQYGRECWCGNDLAKKAFPIDPTGCNIVCAGDKNLHCGAGNRMDLYKTGASVVEYAEPTSTKMGCFTDAGASGHALEQQYVNDKMTVSMCANWAKNSGLKFYALKGGRECWAGNAFDTTATKLNSNVCSQPCKGDASRLCGGAQELSVYSFNAGDFPTLPSPEPLSINLAALTLSDAAVSTVNGKQVIAMTPAPGGHASIAIPSNQFSNIPEDQAVSLSFSMSAAPATGLQRRQTETQCTITILLGPTVWMTQSVKSTEGNFVLVQTPAQTGLSQSITIIQVCPNAPLSLNIGGISIGPPVAAPSSSTTVQSVPTSIAPSQSSSSIVSEQTVVKPSSAPESVGPVETSLQMPVRPSSTTVTGPPREETYVPGGPRTTTSIPQVTTAPNFDHLSTFGAPTYSSGTCSNVWNENEPNTCYFSQKALATTLAIAVATHIPTGSITQSLESCAGICDKFSQCKTWAWDGAAQRCIFYSGDFEEYEGQAFENNEVVYMDKSCYDCNAPFKPSSAAPVPTATPPPVLDSLSTMGAPLYTSGTCSKHPGYGVSTCSYSGMPAATTGAVAAATYIPDGSTDQIMETCAGICSKIPSCGTFHYDAGLKRCIFYSGVFWNYVDGSYSPKYNSITWMDKSCYDCAKPTSSSAMISSTTATPTPPAESTSTEEVPTTTAPAVLTAQAPTTVSACSDGPGDMCNLSGWPMPTPTQGLMAVYTGIPPNNQKWLYPVPQQHICATICQEEEQCQMYFLDRNELNSEEPWTCYLYDYTIDGKDWAMNHYGGVEFDRYQLNAKDCFSCPVQSDETSPITSSSTPTASPSTTAPAILTQQAPASATCGYGTPGDLPCTVSGFPTPASASGLIAVYTGIPKPDNVWEADLQEDICASLCAQNENCQTFALERRQSLPWNCFLYDFNGKDYLLSLSGPFEDDVSKWVWNAKSCFKCVLPSLEPSSTTIATPTTSKAIVTAQGPTTAASCSYAAPESMACSWSNRVTPTSGLLAKYTGIPAATGGWFSANLQDDICARLCQDTEGCETFALERGGWTDPKPWNCYLFAVEGSWPNLVRVAPIDFSYSNWVLHSKTCFDCPAIEDPVVTTTSDTPMTTTSTPSPTITPTSVSGVLTTPVPTMTVPAVITQKAPASAVCNGWGEAECRMSGWPTPASSSGLLAVYTGLPKADSWADDDLQNFICDSLCYEHDGCETYALNRPDTGGDWSCHLYDFSLGLYLAANGMGEERWDGWSFNSKQCFNDCKIKEVPEERTSTKAPVSSTSQFLPTTTPSFPVISAASTYPACGMVTTGQWWTKACTKSGIAMPTTGILAVATGVPAVPASSPDFESRYHQCAAMCAEMNGCEGFALDRGNWPNDLSDWSCNFYDFNVDQYMSGKTYQSSYGRIVWFDDECYSCDAPNSIPTTTTSLTTLTTSTITSGSGTTTTKLPVQNPTATCIPNYSADDSLGCNLRGFAPPNTSDVVIENVKTREMCVLSCYSNADCQSYMFVPEEEYCFIYPINAWDTLGDVTYGGKAYRDNIMNDRGCYYCS